MDLSNWYDDARRNETIVNQGESIQAALDSIGPGETVRVMAGTYREGDLVYNDHKRLLLDPNATIDGSETVIGWNSGLDGGFNIARASDVSAQIEPSTVDWSGTGILTTGKQLSTLYNTNIGDTRKLKRVMSRGDLEPGAFWENGTGYAFQTDNVGTTQFLFPNAVPAVNPADLDIRFGWSQLNNSLPRLVLGTDYTVDTVGIMVRVTLTNTPNPWQKLVVSEFRTQVQPGSLYTHSTESVTAGVWSYSRRKYAVLSSEAVNTNARGTVLQGGSVRFFANRFQAGAISANHLIGFAAVDVHFEYIHASAIFLGHGCALFGGSSYKVDHMVAVTEISTSGLGDVVGKPYRPTIVYHESRECFDAYLFDDQWSGASLCKLINCRRGLVYKNRVIKGGGMAIWFDVNAEDTEIIENYVTLCEGRGIFYEICQGATIKGNVLVFNNLRFDRRIATITAAALWMWANEILVASSPDVIIEDNVVISRYGLIGWLDNDTRDGEYTDAVGNVRGQGQPVIEINGGHARTIRNFVRNNRLMLYSGGNYVSPIYGAVGIYFGAMNSFNALDNIDVVGNNRGRLEASDINGNTFPEVINNAQQWILGNFYSQGSDVRSADGRVYSVTTPGGHNAAGNDTDLANGSDTAGTYQEHGRVANPGFLRDRVTEGSPVHGYWMMEYFNTAQGNQAWTDNDIKISQRFDFNMFCCPQTDPTMAGSDTVGGGMTYLDKDAYQTSPLFGAGNNVAQFDEPRISDANVVNATPNTVNVILEQVAARMPDASMTGDWTVYVDEEPFTPTSISNVNTTRIELTLPVNVTAGQSIILEYLPENYDWESAIAMVGEVIDVGYCAGKTVVNQVT